MIVLSGFLRAQDPSASLNPTTFNVAPPAPNAAALGRYGDVPVNLFNGLPQVSVPLGKITVGNEYSSDLSLSYHAGGNRVNDVASNVGLGWSLIAGGVITRTVRGLPDEGGYVKGDGKLIISSKPNDMRNINQYDTFRSATIGLKDTQPDEFNYNVGGFSGKFVVNTDQQVVLLPYKDIKITWVPNGALNMYFTMNTPDGTIFVFKDQEITQNTSSCGGEYQEYTSSWYLTQIILPKSRRTIDFTYDTDKGYKVRTLTQTESRSTATMTGCPSIIPVVKSCYNDRTTNQKLLKAVTFPGGKVFFNYNTIRTDVSNDNNDAFYALSDITFSSGDNNVYTNLNKYLLSYSNTGRLMLDKVTLADAGGNGISFYNFTYNSQGLPAPNSFGQDHWGYSNGVSNNSNLIPADNDYTGANRDATPSFAVSGILQRIIYPTGGSTSFEFEGNSYSMYGNSTEVDESIYTSYTKSGSVSAFEDKLSDSDSFDVTIPYDQYVNANVNRHSAQNGTNTLTYKLVSANGMGTNIANGIQDLYMRAGQYRFYLSVYNDDYSTSTTISRIVLTYKELVGKSYILTGGGVRLKKMTTYDGIDHKNDIIKTYTYDLASDPTRSSGYLVVQPKYDYRLSYYSGNQSSTTPCTVNYRTSAANNEIETGGSSVVYREVLESTVGNGSTRYVFTVSPRPGISGYPFGPVTNDAPDRGLLVAQYTYTAGGKLVAMKENSYTTYAKNVVPGWKPGYLTRWDIYPQYEHFTSNYYDYKSEVALLSKVVNIEYESNGALITTVENFYDNLDHIQPTRVHVTNSQGDDIWNYTKYATDYNLSGASIGNSLQAIKAMQDSFIHNLPIEQYVQQVRNGTTTTIEGQFIRYKQITATAGIQLQMDTVFTLKKIPFFTKFSPASIVGTELVKNGNYEARINYTRYDVNGNILEQKKIGDIPEAYIWGYNSLYPVAKIIGTTYDNAILNLNAGLINAPASDDQLRGELQSVRTRLPLTMVSTYTFKPLIGVTSETDPAGRTTFYEYDLFGRLKVIRDQNGKVLKQFSYQFGQPITQ
jgi:YD repeat-containing protein